MRDEYIKQLEERVEYLERELQDTQEQYKDIEIRYRLFGSNNGIGRNLGCYITLEDAQKAAKEDNRKYRTGPEISCWPDPKQYIVTKEVLLNNKIKNDEVVWEWTPND